MRDASQKQQSSLERETQRALLKKGRSYDGFVSLSLHPSSSSRVVVIVTGVSPYAEFHQ